MRKSSIRIHAPLFPIALSFIIGIVLGENITDLPVILIALFLTFFFVFLFRNSPRWQTIAIYAVVLLLGMAWSNISLKKLNIKWSDGSIPLDVVVISEPVVKERFIVFDALTVNGHHKIRYRISKDKYSEQIAIGQGLHTISEIKAIHQWYNGHFDYQRYMLCHRFCGETFVGRGRWQWKTLTLDGLSLIQRARLHALLLRHKLLQHYRQWKFTDEQYGIVAAMTLGDKSQLTPQLRDIYSQVGASHVLALSGLHLMIIYAVISMFIGWWRFRTLSQVLTVLSIWAFAFLVGLSPSVVRSAFMISVYALLSIGYRERMSVNTIAFTAIIMLIINPFSLYDVGFQLSFMAVLAIILFNPLFTAIIPLHILQRHRWLNIIWGLTTVSISAQVGTAPLVAYYFGKLPTYFLISNFIAIPLATLILYLVLVCLATFWWSSLQLLLATVLAEVVGFMNSLLSMVATLPKNSIENISLSPLQLSLTYLFITCLWLLLLLVGQRHDG